MLFSKPVLTLQPYVNNIWYCRQQLHHPETTFTLPFNAIEIVINLAGNYEIKYSGMPFKKMDLWISGQLTKPTITRIAGEHECIGVVFTTLGFSAFSKIAAHELTDRSVSLDNIFGNEITALKTELGELELPQRKIDRLEQFFLERLIPPGYSPVIMEALHSIDSSREKKKLTIKYLCDSLKISRNSLNKHFKKYIGLSASTYLQQKVFNNIISDISNTPAERLITVGYDYDFFDQAHFIKQFQIFAGMTPGQYLHFAKNNAIDKSFPNFIRQ